MPTTIAAATFVWVAASADQGVKGEFQILTELQPSIGMGQGHHVPNQVGNPLGGGVGDVVYRDDYHVVPDAHAPVLAPVAG
jgi:hypothetical protein